MFQSKVSHHIKNQENQKLNEKQNKKKSHRKRERRRERGEIERQRIDKYRMIPNFLLNLNQDKDA